MESSDSMPPEMEPSPGEDIILIETVKRIVTREGHNESEGAEEDFFLISQDQTVQYPEPEGPNVEVSNRHQTDALAWMRLCRICANSSDHMIPIYEGVGVQHDLSSKILKYLPIHVSESDTLPLQLCNRCANVLMAWHELSEGCLSAERKLLELQDAQLQDVQDKQQYYNPTSLDNLELTTPILTTASTTPNVINSSLDQQDDEKNGVCDTEKNSCDTDKSNRLKNQIVTHDPIISHNYSRQAYKIGENRSKIYFIQTKTFNVIDKGSKSIIYPDNKLTKCLSSTSISPKTSSSDKLMNNEEEKSREHQDSNSANQMRVSCATITRTKVIRNSSQQESAMEMNESNEHLKKNVRQSKFKKAVCISPTMVCKFCNKKFRSRKSYWAHVRTHSSEKSYTCHICGKQFVHGGSLYYHLKHVHDGVKNHTCDICGRSFAMKTAMEDHRRIHTGERPYVCHTCGKTFKTKASLYIHSKTHTDEFPHKCTYCAKKFRWRQQMLGHLTVHTGEKNHTCDVCGKGFGVKNDLTRHKHVHSEEKPYTCQQCGISFGQKRYLKRHERLKLGTCGYSQSSRRIEPD
ncbi:zinc finger protein 567 isoform X4 [Monomorium pharaonis]|uniref:zinc finger protein 567 isoform X4 n=1 Tax=Monomorium pharaonis TaxID=307658 RepID=UPI00063FA71C|nr:zinc finger protein 567 isoform X4 [Monomorium pharaonis]